MVRLVQAAEWEMNMEGTAAKQALEKATDQAILGERKSPATSSAGVSAAGAKEKKLVGYGMPCATCRSYYPADMHTCPICQSKDRISARAVARAAVTPAASATPAQSHSEEAKSLAEERERLRELKSQIYASHPPVAPATFRCALDQNHTGTVEPAAVCHSCYSAARQQAERMESALRMDPKDAARIVYEAVWADPSDPNKTYLNAANALLTNCAIEPASS